MLLEEQNQVRGACAASARPPALAAPRVRATAARVVRQFAERAHRGEERVHVRVAVHLLERLLRHVFAVPPNDLGQHGIQVDWVLFAPRLGQQARG